MKRTLIIVGSLIALLAIIGVIVWSLQKPVYQPALDPSQFVAAINNPYFTLTPGTTFIYEGRTTDGYEHIEVEVTADKKTILGVETTVVHDRAYLDNELIENTTDWYAQDKDGNVWYFGEATTQTGSWEAGVDGALPGIIMQAQPVLGQEYRQEYYKGVAEDMAAIEAIGQNIDTANGAYTNCLKTRDWNPLQKYSDEFKWYCPQVGGLTLETNFEGTERLELIKIIK